MTTTQHTSTKQDILDYLLKNGEGTALELAETLNISPQATRRHLKDLEEMSLIEFKSVQTGMGRPNHVYQLSRLGRDRYPHRYGDFTVSFLDTLMETVGEEQVTEVLHKQWQRKALEYRQKIGQGSLKDRINNLVNIRQEEGYMAEIHVVKRSQDAEQYVFAEHNCAISDVAESFPNICGHELEMFSDILPDCVVERTHWINNGEHSCGYLIKSKN
jgi:DeoR family transcriptional regulator, suf operon transcriptional repressor